MELFDFINSDEFRVCLERDYQELNGVIEAGCWKAAHVIAGSIVEAILIDYLDSTDFKKRTRIDPLTLDLSQAIEASVNDKILSDKAAGLAHVVRGYRNLIHPGRVLRLGETVDGDGARVAQALVNIVAKEVSAKVQAVSGYTAKQIVSKVEKDPSAVSILTHLLNSCSPIECERLLITVLPTRFREVSNDPLAEYDTNRVCAALQAAFRAAFEFATEEIKRRVMKRYVTILKEESGDLVREYEEAFVCAPDVQFLDPNDAALVKTHLLARLAEDASIPVLKIVDGLARFATRDDINKFVDPLVRLAHRSRSAPLSQTATQVLRRAYFSTTEEQDSWIIERLDAWVKMYKERGRDAPAQIVEEIKTTFGPFEGPFAKE